MSREEALKQLKKPAYDPNKIHQDFEYIANKLDISLKELNSYMNIPKKTYKDYKSQRHIYDFGAKVLKFMGMEKGGKR